MTTTDNTLHKGYLSMVLAGLSFALMVSSSRIASQQVDPLFIVWLRGLGGALILIPFMLRKKISLLGSNHKKLLLRSLLGTASVCLVFYSVSLIPVADAVSLFKTSTLYVPFLAAYFLKEKLDRRVLLITGFGFLGVMLVIQPGYSQINLGIILALLAGFFQGLIFVTLRGLSKLENPLTVVLYFLSGSALFIMPFIPWPTTQAVQSTLLPLSSTVISGLLGQLLLTYAYDNAPAARVTPFIYSEVLFSAIFGWIMLAEWPNIGKLIGMVVICSSGIILASNFGKKSSGNAINKL